MEIGGDDYNKLVKKYGMDVVFNGFEDFDRHVRDRKKGLEELNHKKAKQDAAYSQHNKDFGVNKSWDFKSHLKHFENEMDARELKIALKHGHAEKQIEKEVLSTNEKLKLAKENFLEEKDLETNVSKKEMELNTKGETSTAPKEQSQEINEKERADKLAKELAELKLALEECRDRNREKER